MAMNNDSCVEGACEGSGLDAAEALFHSLSDGTRLAIVQRLARGEARVTDLVEQLGLAQSTVSKHVSCLRDCGLVEGRPQGRQVFYSLSRPELMQLLAAAETLLAATGNAVALCPTYGTDSAAAAERAGSGSGAGSTAAAGSRSGAGSGSGTGSETDEGPAARTSAAVRDE